MTLSRSSLESTNAFYDKASCPEDIFGDLPGSLADRLAALKARWRAVSRTCHPDLAEPADKPLATEAFQRLNAWEEQARRKVVAGTYGDRRDAPLSTPAYTPVEFDVRGKRVAFTGLIAEGVFASVHTAEYDSGRPGDDGRVKFVKFARNPADSDLLEREYKTLLALQLPDADPVAELGFFSKQRAYVPAPLISFSMLAQDNAKRRANLLAVPAGRCFTAETLRRDKFAGRIEPKHVWWIFRRLLLTLWMAHLRGFVHGGVTPDHVLVYPEAHGLVLLDWTCAAKIEEETVPAVNPSWDGFYSPELLRKEFAAPSMDIYTAAATALYMLGGDPATLQMPASVSPPIANLLAQCLSANPSRRPQDAGALHEEFGARLGKREYAEMIVP